MSHEDAPALDPEELAAYIDGRLSGTRKMRVEEALARNEDDYEIFLESVRTLEAEGLLDEVVVEDEGRNDNVVRLKPRAASPGSPILRWASAAGSLLAASLALTVGLWFATVGMSPADFAKQTKPTTIITSPLIPETSSWDDPHWKRYRSAEPPPAGHYDDEEIAFRLGVRAVDLRVATAHRDRTRLIYLVRNTGSWANAGNLVPSELAFEDITEQLDRLKEQTNTLLPDDIDQQLDAAEREVEADVAVDPLMKRRYRLGLWAETGRLATLAGDADTLRSRRFRWHRTGLARDDPDRAEATALVTALKLRLKRDPTTEADFDAIGQQFVELIYLLAG